MDHEGFIEHCASRSNTLVFCFEVETQRQANESRKHHLESKQCCIYYPKHSR
jgi:hypothetical protein